MPTSSKPRNSCRSATSVSRRPPPRRRPARGCRDPKEKLAIYQLVMSSIELNEAGKPDEALAALKRAAAMDRVGHAGALPAGPDPRRPAALRRSGGRARAHHRAQSAARARALQAGARLAAARADSRCAETRAEDGDRGRAAQRARAFTTSRRSRTRAAISARAESLERQALAIDGDYFDAWNTLGAIFVVEKRAARGGAGAEQGDRAAGRRADRRNTTWRSRCRRRAISTPRRPRPTRPARWSRGIASEPDAARELRRRHS